MVCTTGNLEGEYICRTLYTALYRVFPVTGKTFNISRKPLSIWQGIPVKLRFHIDLTGNPCCIYSWITGEKWFTGFSCTLYRALDSVGCTTIIRTDIFLGFESALKGSKWLLIWYATVLGYREIAQKNWWSYLNNCRLFSIL